MSHYLSKMLAVSFDEAVTRAMEALKKEVFGSVICDSPRFNSTVPPECFPSQRFPASDRQQFPCTDFGCVGPRLSLGRT